MGLRVRESPLFTAARTQTVKRGALFALFRHGATIRRFAACVALGVPAWLVGAFLITLAPEIGAALQVQGPVTVAQATYVYGFGAVPGDLLGDVLSQILRSRRGSIVVSLSLSLVVLTTLVPSSGLSLPMLQATSFVYSVGNGHRVNFDALVAENFGHQLPRDRHDGRSQPSLRPKQTYPHGDDYTSRVLRRRLEP